jgi:hypothetical protein
MIRSMALAVMALVFLSPSLMGQSLLGSRGLGFPLEPLDARARALGSVGVGLKGSALVPTDPAAAAGIEFPSVELTVQPQWAESTMGEDSDRIQGTRFPFMGIAYPVYGLKGTVTLTIGGFMDQRWHLQRESTADLGGTTVPALDEFRSDGGVSTFRLGWAQRIGEDLALGGSLGTRAGSVARTFTRTLTVDAPGVEVIPYRVRSEWQYSGLTASFGARWDPAEFLRVAGTATWSASLKADPAEGTQGDDAAFQLPLEVRLGASGLLTSGLTMTLGLAYADWQPSAGGLREEDVAGAVWSYGGGLEWTGTQLRSRRTAVRMGARKSNLPFRFAGENPTETLVAGGIGLDLTRPQDVIVGGLDLAVERGWRDAGSLEESFWRGTLTFRIASW